MEVNINLSKDNIVEEVKNNFENDVDLFFEIIDSATNNYDAVRDITVRLLDFLEKQNELKDILDRRSSQNKKASNY